jgi:MHS family proline/betaine transporter-like MFS transporter
MMTMPIAGHLSDIWGRFRTIKYATIAIILFSLPCFLLIGNEQFYAQIIGLTILAIMAGFIAGSAYVFIILLFPAQYRFSGVAFSYNLGIALCGGTSAAISCYLVSVTEKHYAPAFYIMLIAGIFALVTYILSDWIEYILSKHEHQSNQ